MIDINATAMMPGLESRQDSSKSVSLENRKETVWWEGYPTQMDLAEAAVDKGAEKRLTKIQK